MRRRRRSWFDRPRWWVDYLLFAVTTAAAMWALRWLGAPAVSWDQVAFLSVLMPIGPTWLYQRAHRAWEQLERSTPGTRAELDAAVEVVLRRRSSTDPAVLREAVRVADLGRRELGSPTTGLVTTSLVAGVLVVVAAVTQALWPLPVAAVGLLLTTRPRGGPGCCSDARPSCAPSWPRLASRRTRRSTMTRTGRATTSEHGPALPEAPA